MFNGYTVILGGGGIAETLSDKKLKTGKIKFFNGGIF